MLQAFQRQHLAAAPVMAHHSFAAEFDPRPMHLDETAASATMLGGLGASGGHICCLLMRIIADGFVNQTHSMGAPGVDEVRWLSPLRPNTQVRVRATVLETRPSRSREDFGFVKCMFEMIDEHEKVLTTLTASAQARTLLRDPRSSSTTEKLPGALSGKLASTAALALARATQIIG